MKILKTSSGMHKLKISKSEWEGMGKEAGWVTAAWYGDDEWDYKGHHIVVTEDRERDNVKLFHEVTKPNGEIVVADISPYESGREVVELWIDAGCPVRNDGGNWTLETLRSLVLQRKEDAYRRTTTI